MLMRPLAHGLLYAAIAVAFMQPAFAADDKKQEAAPNLKDAKPTATLDVASEEMRLIMGGTKGKGTLHFNGQDYPFTFKSASAGFGGKMVKEMRATGTVYFLTKIEDFEGDYTALASSAMAGSK